MKKLLINSLIFCSLSVSASFEKGLEIAKKMEKANEGFGGETSTMTLVLVDSTGQEITREMLGKSIELDDMDRTLMNFQKPADVKGTKLLTWAHNSKDDDQWLYLPSLRRVKRINSRTRGSSFMGSEFSFEDLGGQSIEKYTFNYLGDEDYQGEKVWKIERKAKGKSSYSRVVLLVSKKYMSAVKVDYFNKRNELLKFSLLSNFKKYKVNGKEMYRASKILMENVQNKKKSIFSWTNRKMGLDLSKRDFVKGALK